MAKNANLGTSLVERLIPTIDRMRRLHQTFGTRPYVVTVVVRQWSGAERGDGTATVISELELDPVPAIAHLDAVNNHRDARLAPFGQDSIARMEMTEVSLAYTEGQLTGKPLLPNQEVYYRLTDASSTEMAPVYYIVEGEIRPDREKTLGWVLWLTWG